MNKKQKSLIVVLSIFIIAICGFLLYKSTQKLVYMEYITLGQEAQSALSIADNSVQIEQEFSFPYKLFSGIGLSIGTNERDNNSRYEVIIMDKTENKQITSFEFNASHVQDNKIFDLTLNSPIEVDNTHKFSIIIRAISKVNPANYIAFWVDETSGTLNYNGEEQTGNLCMSVYGGASNSFWFIFTLVCEIYVVALIIYILYLYVNKKPIKHNSLVQAGLLGIIVFTLLVAFINVEVFTDETDNIIGGMLISEGRVLYRDYYTQHTPVAYLLCALFSICGAGSVEQFRLLNYALMTLIYIGLYLRHKDNFGKAKMMLLPVIQIVFGVLLDINSTMILSDNIQAICMIALLLEFLQYWKDKKLDWKRSIIISLSIFCSFGSAFISVYPIFAICLGVFINEIYYWINNKGITLKEFIQRYWKLVIACIVPFAILFVYLVSTNSFLHAYEQAFKFNTEVYSYYTGLGGSIIQPFFMGIRNFINIIPNSIATIAQGKDILFSITKIILDIGILIVLVNMIRKKEYLKSATLILFMCFGFTRDGFHTIAFWASMITMILMAIDFKKMSYNQKVFSITLIILLSAFTLGNYINQYVTYLFKEMTPISATDLKVMEETSEGEQIFLDIFTCQSTYLVYNNRLPMNRLTFILPWYMDWYETDVVDDLETKRPRFVLFYDEVNATGHTDFFEYFKEYLHENYEQVPGHGLLWELK